MQPLSGGDSKGILLSARSANKAQQPVNTEAFWQKKVEDVAVDEVFFHKYFSKIVKLKQTPGKAPTRASHGSDDENDENDENEDEIWQALVESRPELEGEDDSDMEMLDLEEPDAGSTSDDVDTDSDDGVDLEAQYTDSDASGGEDVFAGEDHSGFDIDELFAKELEAHSLPQSDEVAGETSRQRKKKLKSLPTFASAEDYADMLDDDENEDS